MNDIHYTHIIYVCVYIYILSWWCKISSTTVKCTFCIMLPWLCCIALKKWTRHRHIHTHCVEKSFWNPMRHHLFNIDIALIVFCITLPNQKRLRCSPWNYASRIVWLAGQELITWNSTVETPTPWTVKYHSDIVLVNHDVNALRLTPQVLHGFAIFLDRNLERARSESNTSYEFKCPPSLLSPNSAKAYQRKQCNLRYPKIIFGIAPGIPR